MAIFGLSTAVMFMRGLALEGIGADAAATRLRSEGYRFQQSVFREYYRSAQLAAMGGPLLRDLPERIPIPLRLIQAVPGRFLQPFRTIFEVTGRDSLTGQAVSRHVSITADRILTKLEALQALDRAHGVRGRARYQAMEVDDVQVAAYQVQGPNPYFE